VIVYNLVCKNSHEFEGWFKDSAAFDAQAKSGKVVCPLCDSKSVSKAIMAPAVSGAKKPTATAEESKKMRQFMTGLRKYVQENADYVGPKFASTLSLKPNCDRNLWFRVKASLSQSNQCS